MHCIDLLSYFQIYLLSYVITFPCTFQIINLSLSLALYLSRLLCTKCRLAHFRGWRSLSLSLSLCHSLSVNSFSEGADSHTSEGVDLQFCLVFHSVISETKWHIQPVFSFCANLIPLPQEMKSPRGCVDTSVSTAERLNHRTVDQSNE